MSQPTQKLYLVDGTSQLFRAYFALPGLTNADGLPTNAVYGFTTMLRKLIKDENPPYLAVAFDLKGPVFRHDKYAEYKANRPPTPEDLNVQAPYAKKVCEVLGIPILELAGFEADDLIATFTARARAAGFEVVVVASDKDLMQLVGEGVRLLNPSKDLLLDEDGVEQLFGVRPERVRDVLGLMGDSVDNVPGVPGVGQKTALSAVVTYGEIESIVARAHRFVAVYDARDAVVQGIDAAAKEEALGEQTAARIAAACGTLADSLKSLLEIERDASARERLEAAASILAEADVSALAERVGESGRKAVKPLAALKRELKGLDRGSSKRVWYSVAENEEQALLSKELVTLHYDVPVGFDSDSMLLGDPDRAAAHALFSSLGFRLLVEELEAHSGHAADAPGVATAPPAAAVAYEHVLDSARLEEIVAECRQAGTIAVTAVTDGGDPMRAKLIGVALAASPGCSWYVPLGHDYLGVPAQLEASVVADTLGPLLDDVSVEKVGHDFKADTHILRRHGLPVRGFELDTMIGAFLLNSSRSGYGVGSLAREFLGHEARSIDDVIGTGAKRLSRTTLAIEQLTPHVAERSDLILRLGPVIRERLAAAGLAELYDTIDGPLLPLLARMEEHGIRVDTGLLERMSGEMDESLNRLRGKIHELAGVEFNVDSPKQLREILFERLGLKPLKKTAKSGEASTDAATLEELVTQHDIAREILEYRELAKLKGTYVDTLPRLVHPETGRVHTCYHATGAATGRLSSSDPNLQNIPARSEAGRKIRAAFVPADGYVFLAADYSQIELRVLAHLASDSGLIDAFQAGEDIHRHTASRVFDVEAQLVSPGMRRRAKAVNFGILYGMSETRLAREQGMTRGDARKFIRAYFERFGSVERYIEEVRERAHKDAAVRTMFGRIRLFPQLHQGTNRGVREQALRAAVNTTIQGTAADLMKMAMLAVERGLERTGLDARVLLQVHDELLLEVRTSEIEPAKTLVREAMEGVHRLAVPLVVDQKAGNSWLDVT